MAKIGSVSGTSGNDVLDIHRGDSFQPGRLVAMLSGSWADGGAPLAQLLVNGQVVASGPVWATVETGGSQEMSYTIPAGTTVTSVGVVYINDQFRSTVEDRNLFVNSLSLNGVNLPLNQGTYSPEAHAVQPGERLMAWNGAMVFSGAVVQGAMAADTYNTSITVDAGGGLDAVIYQGRYLNYNLTYSSGEMRIDSKAHDFGPDTIRGTEAVLFNDVGSYGNGDSASITLDGNNRTFNGGTGIDTVAFNGARAEYAISRTSGGNYLVTHNNATDVLVNVERLTFNDATLAVDINGNGGIAYRLYQAAFNRVPDLGGLGYQMSALDNGLSFWQVADNFLHSPEFQSTYGNLSNEQYVRQLYRNVLHREGEDAGVQYHVHNLEVGATLRFQTLVQFSESPENQTNVIGTIQNGMVYTL